MGDAIKEGTYWDEYWVSYISAESLGSVPETNTTLLTNLNLSKLIFLKRIMKQQQKAYKPKQNKQTKNSPKEI